MKSKVYEYIGKWQITLMTKINFNKESKSIIQKKNTNIFTGIDTF